MRLLLGLVCGPALAAAPQSWVLIPQPKFLAHQVTQPIAAAKETVLAAARWTEIGPEFSTDAEWKEAGLDEKALALATRELAVKWLKSMTPQFIRDERKVVELALLKSDKVPVAALVLAPEFLKEFESVFGPKMIVVMPNLYTVFVFPGIASRHDSYSDLVLAAWHSSAPKVSREVFELTADGLRAVGIFEQ